MAVLFLYCDIRKHHQFRLDGRMQYAPTDYRIYPRAILMGY